ncbi:MAG: membrane protein insertase YidC [Epsilonproteobacteria bacterium]|nr:membrane protein insertase YidC [Campylobacterota bacterium]
MTNNTLNKNDTQKKILIATVISFAFFIGYDFLYLQPQQLLEQQKKEQLAKQQTKQEVLTTQNTVTPASNNATTTIGANAAPAVQVNDNNEIISTIKTKTSKIEIDSLGRIAQITLTSSRYQDEEHQAIKLFTPTQLRPLEVRFMDAAVNNEAFKIKVEASSAALDASSTPVKLTLTQKLPTTMLTKNLTIYPDGHYDLDIATDTKQNYFITPGYRPNVLADVYADHGALLIKNDGTLNIIEDEDLEKNSDFVGIQAVSGFDRYYATVLYNFDKNLQVTVMNNNTQSPESFIHVMNNISLHGYAGPKEYKTLNTLDTRLTGVIEYGWFTFIAKPMFSMLEYIYGYIGNWGWTIVMLTILVKLILLPLSHKGMVSMNKLKELAPKIKAIQEKYGNDKQKASMHMMELYKKEGANPMGGCLPVILQIPVFFAIYRVLINAIELKGSEWILWIDDLSAMDPYFVLPILMGATMYIQQRITPMQVQDEMQQKIFQWLPVVFTVFFLWFPAGLTLYWFINNLVTVSQQYYVNKLFIKEKALRHEEHLAAKHHIKEK